MHARSQKVIALYLFDSSQCKAIFHNTYYWNYSIFCGVYRC